MRKLASLLIFCAAISLAAPYQQKAFNNGALPSSGAFPENIGLSWQDVVSIPTISTWSLNPAGDAAIVRTVTIDVETDTPSYGLHLLAINAQYTVPTALHGTTHPSAFYSFITNDTFVTLLPSQSSFGSWDFTLQALNYTTIPPAWAPTASKPTILKTVPLGNRRPQSMVYSAKARVLSVVLDEGSKNGSRGTPGPLALFSIAEQDNLWTIEQLTISLEGDLAINEIAAGDSAIVFTAHNPAIRPRNATRSILYFLDLSSPSCPIKISSGSFGAVWSPALSSNGQIAWLEQPEDGNWRGRKELWMYDGHISWKVPLKDWDLSISSVIFSKNSEALNLLTLHDQDTSIFHIWTPTRSSPPSSPVRIPSNGTIHSAYHVGITPLDHSHLIGVMSSLTSAHELWVISHSPHDDPAYNYENIRLTYFSKPTLRGRQLSEGESIEFVNELGSTVKGKVFLPSNTKSQENVPVVLLLHGDGNSGGWRNQWMQYWNQNALINEGYAVITVNPTGSEGYGDYFAQSLRFNWGNQTIKDISLGLTHSFALFSSLDSSSVTAMGYGAYGGFVTHWIQGHPTDFVTPNGEPVRWKKLVAHNGVLSPRWWAAETPCPAKVEWEFGEISYDDASPFSLWDPEHFAGEWAIPELVIHDGRDDCDAGPLSQSYASFALLQSRGVKSEILVSDKQAFSKWHRAIFELFVPL
ncbi:hypothetical protein I307_00048 [Cryptococcus deuterogattii 99/473]|uniref:Dipeptidyl-peptidase V n=1 Tax=Cryptococcus deuterogattii Ram5 TaxID=1296110 RepID=A0A0D0VBS3_9TREE|nr:hypothetical protein I313_00755 [Cryptococcus deuterogattii Ram5]KIY60249.1 hypothetical protein I307_00048 [Cryptococcus deuterogattii 99/473]